MRQWQCIGALALGVLASGNAAALDVNVVGLYPNKAVVQIDGGRLQTLSIGQKSAEGVVLLSVEGDQATFEVDGQRVTLSMGHARMKASSAPPSVLLSANERGHFLTDGQINGIPIRFAVDTGATFISLPAREARRLGLDYRKGQRAIMETANGNAPAYRIQLDTVRVGDITVHNVDAVVMEGDNPSVALLGMSFLNRMDIKREGEIMTLTKRY
ncbi:MAG TPA: TIGR02281 family clan AA aspartic protease [Casimicrobiaceae bacterium]|nr:TIGR02281 family clan AA aspartic protease [Casimicrobiaceae bacterium]